jgi:Arc/MetJ-type ribon-helix-helix transcriptional regulator
MMNITLYPEIEKFVDEKVRTGRFPSAEEAVNKMLLEIRQRDRLGLSEELSALASECASSNWDGHGALAVSEATVAQARRYLDALPGSVPTPSLGAEPDGDITFEWHHSQDRNLSVSITSGGLLHYAALLGSGKAYGTEAFDGEIPQAILNLISRVGAT